MSKKITFHVKPSKKESVDVEAWVKNRTLLQDTIPQEIAPEKMQRFTIDVPISLHRKIKTSCASRSVKMADEIRHLLYQHYDN